MRIRTINQRRAFQFLREKFETLETFTRDEFRLATGFSKGSFNNYLSKQFRGLLLPVGTNLFRVSGVFRLFRTWSQFQDKVVTQKRNWGRQYAHLKFDNVVIFEFYMPLRNEEYLRETLDALFFKDAVMLLLKGITNEALIANFPQEVDEADECYLERVFQFISDKFGGYSIIHVNGRFRAGSLKNRAEIFAGNAIAPARYIVDETTAIVRFIIPCDEQRSEPSAAAKAAKNEAEMIRWFFEQLFLKSILEVVNAEDEIWLVESGMRSRLHILRAKD
jgi:hypothetical protein